MKILLLTSYFYPDEHIGASRWNRHAKYLRRLGHEIYVIASDNFADYNCPPLCNGISRINLNTSFPDRILKFMNRAKKNLSIEKQRQSYEVNPKNGFVRFYVRIMSFIGKISRFPNRYWWSSGEMVSVGLNLIRDKKIDIIVATHPFPGCLKAAHLLSKKTGLKWVADMRDGWSSYYYSEYPAGSFFNKVIIKLEKKYLKSSVQVVTVNNKLGNTLQVSKDKIVIIPNSFDPEVTFLQENKPDNDNRSIEFSFAGNILEDHCWDIFLLGLAEFMAQRNNINITVNYFGSSFDILRAQGNAVGIPDYVFKNHGYLPKNKLKQELSNADFLLVFGFHGSYGDTVTTGKIFDYIEVKKPVIVIGGIDSELALMVRETGIGIVVSQEDSVKNLLNDIYIDKSEVINKIKLSRNQIAIEKYSALETSKHYAKLLSSLIC